MPADPKNLDPIDLQIIDALREDGRATNRALAQQIGIAEATIAARIKDLYDRRVMRVTGMLTLEASGQPLAATVGIRVLGRSIEEIAGELSEIEEVQSVMSVLGRYDIYVGLSARDLKHLRVLLEEHIGTIPGVESLECLLALEPIRHLRKWAKP